jgi:hypothetical protein
MSVATGSSTTSWATWRPAWGRGAVLSCRRDRVPGNDHGIPVHGLSGPGGEREACRRQSQAPGRSIGLVRQAHDRRHCVAAYVYCAVGTIHAEPSQPCPAAVTGIEEPGGPPKNTPIGVQGAVRSEQPRDSSTTITWPMVGSVTLPDRSAKMSTGCATRELGWQLAATSHDSLTGI